MDNDDYVYTNLTSAVGDRNSPLRRYLGERFPNTKPVQGEYKKRAGQLLVDGGPAKPGTVGAAFDYAVRFTLDPNYVPTLAAAGFIRERAATAAIMGVADATRNAARDSEQLLRGVWALALCTEVYRAGLMPGSPLTALLHEGRFTTSELLTLASDDALRQLVALRDVSGAANLALGPTFDGSILCAADADLICDGSLLELKSHLGSKNSAGIRVDTLDLKDLYQLVAYALFDKTDAHRIRSFGVYSARYGTFISWPLKETFTQMAGTTVDLTEEREVVWSLLGGS
jgi:hypothetical protein